MSDRSAKSELLYPLIFAFAEKIKAEPADKFRFIRGISRDAAAAVESARPVLHHAAANVSVDHRSRTAKCRTRRRIQQCLEAALHKIKISGANSCLLSEGFFELPGLKLNFRSDSDVQVGIAHDCAGRRVCVSQNGKVKMRAVISLESKPRPPDQERVRRRAITLEGSVIRIQIAVWTDAELAVRALDEKVLAIPSRRQRRLFFGRGARSRIYHRGHRGRV